MVSVAAKKKVVRTLVEQGKAKTMQICRAIGLSRSSFYASGQRCAKSIEIEQEVIKLSQKNPRYGYRRITALLCRAGHKVNPKRIQSLRRKHGFQVRRKQKKMKRVKPDQSERLTASNAGQVWSWDFVFDQTECGASFRLLSVMDEYTRQCHNLRPRHSYRATDVIEVLEELIDEHGAPEYIRSDNGPEFIAYVIQDWLETQGIKTHYITPGSPWENGHIESFHDKLRDEFLNREIFYTLKEAAILLEDWRKEYNTERIHSSLDYRTPAEFSDDCKSALRTTSSSPTCSVNQNTSPLIPTPTLAESTV